MIDPTLRDFADAVERIAFSIPAPNEYTPQLAMLSGSMRQQAMRREGAEPDLIAALKRAEAFFSAMHIVIEPEDIPRRRDACSPQQDGGEGMTRNSPWDSGRLSGDCSHLCAELRRDPSKAC